jgi:ribosomal protein S18 acetylase RimI-like enzyme
VPDELRIRPASSPDDDVLRRLDLTWTDPGTYVALPDPNRPFFATTRLEDVLVAVLSGEVVGYVKVRPPTPLPSNAHVQQIQGLAVAPRARRRGVGAALLAAAEEEARRRGARKLSLRVLATNRGGRRLYDACGFTVEGVLREEFRLADGGFTDDVLMAKRL